MKYILLLRSLDSTLLRSLVIESRLVIGTVLIFEVAWRLLWMEEKMILRLT